ncbi:MAG: Lactoylglutathione lyase [Sodalis sp.]|nr:MAG: Lactoylglutathione lyase [Sodalis sp.]
MRLLRTMLRISDLQCSTDFYTKVLEMRLLHTSENLAIYVAFVRYTSEGEGAVIELIYNWSAESYAWAAPLGISP